MIGVIHKECGGVCHPVFSTSDSKQSFVPECDNCGVVPDHETIVHPTEEQVERIRGDEERDTQ
jgi:hypothetical protein